MFQYQLNGLRFASELELPTKEHPFKEEPEVTLKLGSVPAQLDNPVVKGARHMSAPNQYILDGTGVAKFAVFNGDEIIVDIYPGAPIDDVILFLNGTVLAALAHQRGLLPLHSSVIEYKGKAILFIGVSGAGKSTTAAAFQQLGFPLVTDDVATIDIIDDVPYTFPNLPRLKLWKRSLHMLSLENEEYNKVRQELNKYYVPTAGNFSTKVQLELDTVFYITTNAELQEPTVKPLEGIEKFHTLKHNVHRSRLVRGFKQTVPNFQILSKVANHCKVYHLARPNIDEKSCVDAVVELISKTLKGELNAEKAQS